MNNADDLIWLSNPRHGMPGLVVLPAGGFARAKAAITAWDGYAPTPLHDLPGIANEAGVATVRIKDEGQRFGLGSFKALGGAYAVARLVAAEAARAATPARNITVCCATDGNHGRAVAWGAARSGCACVVFVHERVSPGRISAIARHGARVIQVTGNYDDSVRIADSEAKQHGWIVVSDTSYPGYTDIPREVMQGYRLMADEAADQWSGPPPTHVLVQAGVGGAAAAVSVQMRTRFAPAPRLIVVEPLQAACLLASARAGRPVAVTGELNTVMAGLACGEPSLIAWQELERAAWGFMAIADRVALDALRLLALQNISLGESGVAGLAALRLAAKNPAVRADLGLTATSRVLLFGTEGITDPKIYDKILHSPGC